MKKFRINETITNRDNDSFKKYLLEVSAIDVLTVDEEYEIAVQAHQGDEKCLELLVKHNLRFVISVAKQYVKHELKLEDLVNEGNLGLIYAAERFDPTLGFKFISYGVWWIKRSILAYIADHGRTIRLPNNKNNVMHKLNGKFEELEQLIEKRPTYSELLEYVEGEFSPSDVAFYVDTTSSAMISLDATIKNDGSETAYSNLIKDNNVVRTDYLVNDKDSDYNITQMLKLLKNDNERKVLTYVFGLDGGEPLKLKNIGLILGLTSERVRQIRDAALSKLRCSTKRFQ
jgi:RNA polymerase primary sigma factor